ncbi:MAG: hypothetical protein ACYSU0_08800 [Planctomycetota bacterium]
MTSTAHGRERARAPSREKRPRLLPPFSPLFPALSCLDLMRLV